eukprot:gene17206-20505_t
MSLSDWENVKENILPLKTGRDPSMLASTFGAHGNTQTAQVNNENIAKERDQIEKDIAEYKGDDPLDLWLKYVKWVCQTYTSGAMKSHLLVLLERCAPMFLQTERYRDDKRYLKLWIQYADMCRDPIDILAYVETNKIGQRLALFYEAKAVICENKGRYKDADEAYKTGILKRAEPVDHLPVRHKEFEKRMMAEIKRRAAAKERGEVLTENDQQTAATTPPVQRAALGTIAAPVVTSERRSMATKGAPLGASTSDDPRKRKTTAPVSSGFKIFDDERGVGDENAQTNAKFVGMSMRKNGEAPTMRWDELEPELSKHKENTQASAKWTDTKIVQKRAKTDAAAPTFEIYVDEDIQQSRTTATAASASMLAATKGPSRLEQIQNNPLANFPKLSQQNANTSMSASTNQALSASTATSAAAKKNERPSYKKEMFVGPKNEEDGLSFEEVRAQQWHEKRAVKMAAEQARRNAMSVPPSPSMTIHTKEALRDIMSMFHTPLACENRSKSNNKKERLDKINQASPSPFTESTDAKPSIFKASAPLLAAVEDDDVENLRDNQENIDPIHAPPAARKVTNGDILKKALFSDEVTEDINSFTIDRFIAQSAPVFEIFEDPTLATTNETPVAAPNALAEKPRPAMFGGGGGMFGGGGGGFAIFQDNPDVPQQQTTEPVPVKKGMFGNNVAPSSGGMFGGGGGGFAIFQDNPDVPQQQPTESLPVKKGMFGNSNVIADQQFTMFEDPQPSRRSTDDITGQLNTEVITIKMAHDGIVRPFEPEFRSMLIAHAQPTLDQADEYVDCEHLPMPDISTGVDLTLGTLSVTVGQQLNSSANPAVFREENSAGVPGALVLKVHRPAAIWPLYIQRLIARDPGNEELFVGVVSLHEFADGSVALMEDMQCGTLAKLLRSTTMDEALKLYYTINLLRVVEQLHKAGVVHTNISPTNLFISMPNSITEADREWHLLRLANFSTAVDLGMYQDTTRFEGALSTEGGAVLDVVPTTWRCEIDYIGMCRTIYYMLSDGKTELSMSLLKKADDQRWQLDTTGLKASLHLNIWKPIFDTLLNSPLAPLAELRATLESYVFSTPAHAKSVIRQLRKIKIDIQSSNQIN